MKEELKPCPFCGKKPFIYDFPHQGWHISCEEDDCYCQPSLKEFYHAREDAVEEWNTRHEESTCPYDTEIILNKPIRSKKC